MAFPSLSVNMDRDHTMNQEDSTIRSDMEGGYEITRPRHTRNRKTFDIKYSTLPQADKATLEAFVETVNGGSDSFSWTNPQNSTAYTVRFSKLPSFRFRSYNLWMCEFQLREV